ncbi:MAG: endonuclease III [Thermodesulfovibrionales bacterium]
MTRTDFLKAWKILKRQLKSLETPWVENDATQHRCPFRVLIACIISLRTKDAVTEMVSKRLFNRAENLQELSKLSVDEIEKLLYPAGFYRSKARIIKGICNHIQTHHNGHVPNTIDELLKIKGVGRKTANLVLTLGFGQDAICVDTHVHRIPNRWGLINTQKPEETEFALYKLVPRAYWREINGCLVGFGQGICKPISPLCSRCDISRYCKRIGVIKSR